MSEQVEYLGITFKSAEDIAEAKQRLQDKLDAITEAERQAWRNMR